MGNIDSRILFMANSIQLMAELRLNPDFRKHVFDNLLDSIFMVFVRIDIHSSQLSTTVSAAIIFVYRLFWIIWWWKVRIAQWLPNLSTLFVVVVFDVAGLYHTNFIFGFSSPIFYPLCSIFKSVWFCSNKCMRITFNRLQPCSICQSSWERDIVWSLHIYMLRLFAVLQQMIEC